MFRDSTGAAFDGSAGWVRLHLVLPSIIPLFILVDLTTAIQCQNSDPLSTWYIPDTTSFSWARSTHKPKFFHFALPRLRSSVLLSVD